MPPLEYRTWVGPTEDSFYENPDGSLVYPDFPAERYESVFDFGCGCGRVARQLILQRPRPQRYVGIDLHPELIAWCRANLEPAAAGFSFHHHDVFDRLVNAGEGKPDVLAFPAPDDSVTLFEALSIFTHIPQRHLPFYLTEAARVLAPNGEMNASFLLFEKADFAALSLDPNRNALYVDDEYPPAAVYFDRQWLQQTLADAGLTITKIAMAPQARGYQWRLIIAPTSPDAIRIELPAPQPA
jgi:SAM-dependent methyltransferase